MKRKTSAGDDQFCMFDSTELASLAPPKPEIPAIEDDRRRSLEWEKETLGLFVSDHPLRPVLHKLKKHADTTVSDLDGSGTGLLCGLGLATSVRVNTTRKGDQMAMLQLDDTRGLAEVIVFPRVYASCADCVREDAVLKVKGRVEHKEGIPRIVALEMEELHLEPGLDPMYLHAACFWICRAPPRGRRSRSSAGTRAAARYSSSRAMESWKSGSGASKIPRTCTQSSSSCSGRSV